MSVLSNALSYDYIGVVKIPKRFIGHNIITENDAELITQEINGDAYCHVSLNAFSFRTFYKGKKQKFNDKRNSALVLENDLVEYTFSTEGTLISAIDKETKKNLLSAPGNVLSLYEDRPLDWDAWDIDFYYRDSLLETARIEKINKVQHGLVLGSLEIDYKIGNSSIKQTISLSNQSKRLDFETFVDWHEKHKMLRVHFPTNITSDQASFDIQYGYVRRNTHKNTSWDRAKFEVVGHKYADLSDNDYGIAILNDCKYGYSILDKTVDLNLLRAPNNPDADADKGEHSFTYSFYPHEHDLIRSNVIEEATKLNHPPLLFDGVKNIESQSPINFEGKGIEISAIKKSEQNNEIIFRAVETLGRTSTGTVYLNGKLTETNLMERRNLKPSKRVNDNFELTLKPFEIKTYKFIL